MASDYDAQMAKNLGGGLADEARAGGVSTGSEGWEAGLGPGFVFSQSCCVNPLAFHNKSQIINKYMPVMSSFLIEEIGRCGVGVIISLSPRFGCFSILLTTPTRPTPGSTSA